MRDDAGSSLAHRGYRIREDRAGNGGRANDG